MGTIDSNSEVELRAWANSLNVNCLRWRAIQIQRIRRHERRRIRPPTDGLIARPALRDRPRENALRSARTNSVAPSQGRKDAERKGGPPPCLLRPYAPSPAFGPKPSGGRRPEGFGPGFLSVRPGRPHRCTRLRESPSIRRIAARIALTGPLRSKAPGSVCAAMAAAWGARMGVRVAPRSAPPPPVGGRQ